MADICVVYLVRAKNGLQPFEDFLRSYAGHPSGIGHELLLVFKGFPHRAAIEPYRALAQEFKPRELVMRDFGFDLRAYGLATRSFDFPFFCCFNSFSQILADGWLAKLHAHICQNEVGLVGATGSWESMYSNALSDCRRAPNPSVLWKLRAASAIQLRRLCFDPFPNYHVRTNAFMMSRKVMRAVWPGAILTKRGAYLFENGKRSLTHRIQQMGLKVLVVGKNGQAYSREDWPASNTFRQGQQSNLLVADNQTRLYANADLETKAFLSRLAWGEIPNRLDSGSAGKICRILPPAAEDH